MLKAEFINDLCHNYMVIEYEGEEDDFALRMLTENMTDDFLAVELRRLDGQKFLYYDISGMQNMEIMYAEKPVDQDAFRTLMWSLQEAVKQVRELFLAGDGICIEPSVMFWNLEKQRWKFVYLLGRDWHTAEEIRKEREQFAEFLVAHIDYEDKELTETVYRFYEEVCAGRIYPEAFLKWESRSENVWERVKPAEEINKGSRDAEEEEDIQNRDLYAAGEMNQDVENKSSVPGKTVRVIVLFLLCLTVVFTVFFSRYYLNIIVPGGVLSIVLFAVFLHIQIKKRQFTVKKRQTDLDAEETEDSGIRSEEDPGPEEMPEEELKEAYEGKTVYMDIQKEQEGKLYGIGKFRRQKISLENLPCMIGKDRSLVDSTVSDSSVSRIHARFFTEAGSLWMQDLNSTNGTYHNGLRLKPNEKVVLEPEDEVGFGRVQFVYR